jgi:hypothetical protein
VKVHRSGVTVAARRSAGSEAGPESVHFDATSCEVSVEHPYPWEPLVTRTASGAIAYSENFSDPRTGWPNRANSRYVSGAYEMYRKLLPTSTALRRVEGTVVAYGPWWSDFRASLLVDDRGSDQEGEGIVFRLNDRGCYAVLLTRIGTRHCSFKLIRKTWPPSLSAPLDSHLESVIIPWADVPDIPQINPAKRTQKKITVECKGEQITIWLDDVQTARINDDRFTDGYIGMAQFGYGRVLFRGLHVESLQR